MLELKAGVISTVAASNGRKRRSRYSGLCPFAGVDACASNRTDRGPSTGQAITRREYDEIECAGLPVNYSEFVIMFCTNIFRRESKCR
jgi:hypothetical protein